jgi:hypothetical protein
LKLHQTTKITLPDPTFEPGAPVKWRSKLEGIGVLLESEGTASTEIGARTAANNWAEHQRANFKTDRPWP